MFTNFAYIAFFLAFSRATFRINQKIASLPKSVFIAIFAGTAIGLSLHLLDTDNGYIHLLKLVVIPLIFIFILSAINKLKNRAGIGRISLTTVLVTLLC